MTARRRYDPEVLAETARLCVDAHGRLPHAQAVAERYDISVTHARYQIAAARYAGHEIPADSSNWRHGAARRLVCECGEWSCPLDAGVPGLQRHTISVHGRQPSRVERTPRVPVAA